MLKFSAQGDRDLILRYYKNENLSIENLAGKEFAQNLRNTILYQELLLDSNKIKVNSTNDIVKEIYLSNTKMNSKAEFRNKSSEMIKEMKILQKVVCKIISVDKDYTIYRTIDFTIVSIEHCQ